jgi:hypothetical protein
MPFALRRLQFPVRPAFAMTINKSQGQTLKMVGVHLPKTVFCHGQLYVALSRAGSKRAVRVLVEGGWVNQGEIDNVPEGKYTANVVHRHHHHQITKLSHSINAIGPAPHRSGRNREHRSIVVLREVLT